MGNRSLRICGHGSRAVSKTGGNQFMSATSIYPFSIELPLIPRTLHGRACVSGSLCIRWDPIHSAYISISWNIHPRGRVDAWVMPKWRTETFNALRPSAEDYTCTPYLTLKWIADVRSDLNEIQLVACLKIIKKRTSHVVFTYINIEVYYVHKSTHYSVVTKNK